MFRKTSTEDRVWGKPILDESGWMTPIRSTTRPTKTFSAKPTSNLSSLGSKA